MTAETPTTCAHCGARIEQRATGRRRLYCGAACKQRAYAKRRLEAAEQAGARRALEELRRRSRPIVR